MGVSAGPGWLSRTAVRGTHVLIVEVPGWALTRIAIERAVAVRGWRPALTPAAADVLVVCGQPGDPWRPVIDRLWAQLPGPRARVDVDRPDQVRQALDLAATTLLADQPHRSRPLDHDGSGRADQDGADGMDEADGANGMADGMNDADGVDDANGMDGADGMDHANGMDGMDGMEMPMPGGIPLAGGAEDRDGLEMDVLSVPLGPVLPAWPAGLVLRCALHGDVIAQAQVTTLPGRPRADGPAHEDGRTRAALDCDAVARLLTLAGSNGAAIGFRGVRDDLLDGASFADCASAVQSLTGRVRRSRLLRWSLRGIGVLDSSGRAERGVTDALAGDVHDRLLARMAGIGSRLLSAGPVAEAEADRGREARAAMDLLPSLVTGLDLGAARLVVASIDPDVAAIEGKAPAHG